MYGSSSGKGAYWQDLALLTTLTGETWARQQSPKRRRADVKVDVRIYILAPNFLLHQPPPQSRFLCMHYTFTEVLSIMVYTTPVIC